MINHHAYFDALLLGKYLQDRLNSATRTEIYLFAYLACLLSLYDKQPASAWDYGFAVTDQGYPYSRALDYVIQLLVRTGSFADKDGYLNITEKGIEELSILATLNIYSQRIRFLKGASSSLLAIPIGTIRNALAESIEIKGAMELHQTRLLFSDSAQNILYEQFADLSSVIGVDVENLMVPAVVWLTYHIQISGLPNQE